MKFICRLQFLTLAVAALLYLAACSSPGGSQAGGAHPVAAKPAKMPQPQAAKVTEPAPAAKTQEPPRKEISTPAPFVMAGGFDDLSPRAKDQGMMFESEEAFRHYLDEHWQVVWPIGRFASEARPLREADFRQVLREHAAAIGADFVVLVTDHGEINRLFHPQYDELNYCALAYRRVAAQVGLQISQQGQPLKKVLKVAGFVGGSNGAEAGIHVGDILKTVDGVEAGTEDYWRKAVHWKVGDTVKITVERAGETKEIEVILIAG